MQQTRKPRVWLTSSLLLLVALLATCASPSPKGTTPTDSHHKAPASQQIYISGLLGGEPDFTTLDPALVINLHDPIAVDDVFVGLVAGNDQGLVTCELCSSYSVASDGVTWTFNLRPNLKFSDGTPLTSADVVYSINRALDPRTQSGSGPYFLRYIKDATAFAGGSKTIKTLIGDSLLAPDAQTVKIVAVQPAAFFLATLTSSSSYVVEKSVIQQWGTHWTDHLADNGGQGGAGPWKVQEYTHRKQFVVVPNTNYWGPQPQLRKLIYQFFKKADTTYQVYQLNLLDDTAIPIADIDAAGMRPDFHQAPQLWINYYTMNYSQKPFDVVACRQAFALAINKNLIVQTAWKNTLLPTNHIVPKGEYGYDSSLTGPDGTTSTGGNTTQAKTDLQACMTAEGYTSVSQFPPITLTIPNADVQAFRDEEATLQQEWQSTLGISVKLNNIDFGRLSNILNGGCAANPLQFWGIGWSADFPDAQNWLTNQFAKNSPNNSMCYGQNKGPSAAEQQQVQTALEAADSNFNSTARAAAYNQAEQSLVNDVAWLPMEQQLTGFLRKPCAQGWVDTSFVFTPPDDWSRIYISTDSPCARTS